MKLEMAKNSLFAILLRSPWWISIAVAAAIVVAARLVLPDAYVIYGIFSSLPFGVIGVYAAWQQLRAPSERRISVTTEALRAMSWNEFSEAIDAAFGREGYAVARMGGSPADFELTRERRISLVACKRWKVARTGVEPLRELYNAKRTREAHEAIYVAAGEFTDNALKFATEKSIRLVHGAELVKLLPRVRRAA